MESINETREAIRQTARRGDYSTVGRMVGLKADTVARIVRGTRKNDLVVRQFSDYLKRRANLEQQLILEGSK